MIKLMKRLLANIIDLFVFFASIVVSFVYINPTLANIMDPNMAAFAILVVICLINFALNYPFMTRGQTIGKAFFSLRVVSDKGEDEYAPQVGVRTMIVREVFGKFMPMYFLCLPLLFGKRGQHEVMTATKVI